MSDTHDPNEGRRRFIMDLIVICTLAAVLVGMVSAMLYGLYDHRVDNAELFKILGPGFSMVIGAFVGYLGGRAERRR